MWPLTASSFDARNGTVGVRRLDPTVPITWSPPPLLLVLVQDGAARLPDSVVVVVLSDSRGRTVIPVLIGLV